MVNFAAYRPYWHAVAHDYEVSDVPRQFILLGERVVLFRDGRDVVAFKDLCIHRGAELSRGKVIDGRIQCPYHGWQYDRSGACVSIPSIGPDRPIPSKARAIPYRAEEKYGMIWVALEEPRLPIPSPPKEWSWEFESSDVRTIKRPLLEWTSSAGRYLENALDVSHFPFVHEGVLGAPTDTLVTPHGVTATDTTIDFHYHQVQPGDPGSYGKGYVHLHYHYCAPFTLFLRRETPSGGFTIFNSNASPTTEKTTRLFSIVARNYDMSPEQDEVFLDFLKVTMDQDESVVGHLHPEEIPTDLREELHIQIPDAAGIALRRILGKIEAAANPA